MISVCMVSLDIIEHFAEIAYLSLGTRSYLVSEVFIAMPDKPTSYERTWEINGVSFTQFGIMGVQRAGQGVEHGLGLHACIKRTHCPYVMFHDPDVFFFPNEKTTDQLFYDLMMKYGLDVIGVSHCASSKFAYTYFPYLSCLLVKKDKLPGEDWMKGEIRDDFNVPYDGKYLIRVKLKKEREACFPNPTGDFDTGSLMWLWGKEQNWKWVSFQTTDVHTYNGMYNRGNVKLTEKFDRNRPFLYHATSCTSLQDDEWKKFKETWDKSDNI